MTDLIADIRSRLIPKLDLLVQYLEQINDEAPLHFFKNLRAVVQSAETEIDMQEAFFQLATTAFQPFELDPMGALLADEVLALAEQVAHTLSAPSGAPN